MIPHGQHQSACIPLLWSHEKEEQYSGPGQQPSPPHRTEISCRCNTAPCILRLWNRTVFIGSCFSGRCQQLNNARGSEPLHQTGRAEGSLLITYALILISDRHPQSNPLSEQEWERAFGIDECCNWIGTLISRCIFFGLYSIRLHSEVQKGTYLKKTAASEGDAGRRSHFPWINRSYWRCTIHQCNQKPPSSIEI